MPDYQFNTNLGPAAQQGTSLADMINTARGAQAFQQAQELNPLALQKAQMEIQQAQQINPLEVQAKQMAIQQSQQTNPLAVRKAAAETKSAEFGLDKTQAALSNEMFGALRNNKAILNAEKDPQSAVREIIKYEKLIENAGVTPEKIAPVSSYLINEAMKNPGNLIGHLDTLIDAGIGAVNQRSMQNGTVQEINGVKYQYNAATGKMVPLGSANTPTTPPNVVNPQNPVAKLSGLVRQDMPVSSGGISQMNAQQAERYTEGQTLQKESTALAQAAQEAKQTSRKIKENIAAASGSAPGQALRSAGKFIAGSEQLDELIKNLADNQMRQAALMGASSSTDQARQVLALANGSENITAKALAQIVQRADATSTALEKFSTGLNKYYEKAGTYNGPIHARNFKQTWSENYDPRIFMVQNINSSNMSGAEKEIQLQALLKGTTEEERKSLAKKAETIKRLEKGDF
jgi:hypothetical protein